MYFVVTYHFLSSITNTISTPLVQIDTYRAYM